MTRPSGKTRAQVLARDDSRCVGCGRYIGIRGGWWSIQHRVARGVGGDDSLPNLIALCGSATSPGCHRLCEDRDREAHERGLWLYSYEDPALVPVMVASGHGSGALMWPTVDGRWSDVPPGEVALTCAA